jgi:transposase
MAVSYSQDLRDRVIKAYERGMKTGAIAEAFAVSPAWARRVKQTLREQDRATPLPRGGARTRKVDREALLRLVNERPDATLIELRDQLEARTGVKCSEAAVCVTLKKLGLSYKKRRSMPPSRIGPMSPSAAMSGAN